MAITFTPDDLFEIAEQIERNGARFYKQAATRTPDPKIREELTRLSFMEENHERVFAGMRKELSRRNRAPESFDPEGDAARYLQDVADGKIFPRDMNPDELLPKDVTLDKIFQVAIGLEKDSVVFYVGMQKLVPGGEEKDRIGKIIEEEMGHIASLTRRRDLLKKGA
ncbi:MAG: ferritin family protein [Planctomycetota bacterium]